jgi:protein-S-isoprenylcysteine O-methyltransferase Ste14
MSKEVKALVGIVSFAPILFLLGLVVSFFLYQLFPFALTHEETLVNIFAIVGVLMLLGGTILAFSAQRISRVVTHPEYKATCPDLMQGPYAYSRHPGSLSLMIMYVGFALIVNSLIMIILACVLILALTLVFVPAQEKVISEMCPESYAEYKSKVRMWL